MRAPTRSHGFAKPSDLEDELLQLDDEMKSTRTKPSTRAKAPAKSSVDASVRREIEELRIEVEEIRREIEKLQAARAQKKQTRHTSRQSEIADWLPVVRSVAITSLAGRIFASSPIMALLVAAVPFAMGLSAGSK